MLPLLLVLLLLISLWGIAHQAIQHQSKLSTSSRPRAVLHIGPHKTSSSRIQGILTNLTEELASVNYNLPVYKMHDGETNDPKGLARFATAFRDKKGKNETTEIRFLVDFLNDSLRLGRDIILSAEAFSTYKQRAIVRLKDLLHGFDVRVVFVYRDVLSHMVSLHFERNRFEHTGNEFSYPFSAFLLQIMDNLSERLQPLQVLRNYSAVFGADNMRIIDLHGTTAAKKEVTHVILCQVAGVLCHHTNLSSIAVFSNPSYSLIPAQVFSHLKAHVVKQNDGKCRFCGSLFHAYEHVSARYLNETTFFPPPAIIATKLTLLLPYAQQLDAQLRETFRDNILEGNREENLKRMAQVQVQELDQAAFLENVHWGNWIQSEFKRALQEGRLCGCSTA